MAGRSWLPPDTGQVSIPGNSKHLAELEGPGLQEKGVLTRPIMKEEPVHKQEQLQKNCKLSKVWLSLTETCVPLSAPSSQRSMIPVWIQSQEMG